MMLLRVHPELKNFCYFGIIYVLLQINLFIKCLQRQKFTQKTCFHVLPSKTSELSQQYMTNIIEAAMRGMKK